MTAFIFFANTIGRRHRNGSAGMSDLVTLVMKAAASELLHQEARQVDQEMEELLAEMALLPALEDRLADYTRHFFTLLERRGHIARRALGIGEGGFFRNF